nr:MULTISPECIES: hypothetical protein [unclassified Streptomyces]
MRTGRVGAAGASVYGSEELGLGQSTLIGAVLLVQVLRDAIMSLVVFFVAGFAPLARVPVRRAVRDAGNPVPDRI